MANREISNTDDIIDVRDVIARIEELETDIETIDDRNDIEYEPQRAELTTLQSLMDNMKGYGGDERWRGDWYPITLINDAYFEQYAQELAYDCGMMPKNLNWPYTCIDWDRAARELQHDYSSVEFDGVTYWYR